MFNIEKKKAKKTQREEIKNIHPTFLLMKVLIKNQNKSNSRLCGTKEKIEKRCIIT